MLPFFDAFVILFVLSFAYMVYRAGVYWIAAAAAAAFAIHRIILFWLSQSGMWSYAIFFAGTVISCALIVILCMLYFNLFAKYEGLVLANRVCGAVAGGLLGLMFVSSVMMPVALKAGPPLNKAAASSFTVSHVVPWVQELFPETQEKIVKRINQVMEPPSPSAPADQKVPLANPFGAPTLQKVSDQLK